jgi:hypothetical protein
MSWPVGILLIGLSSPCQNEEKRPGDGVVPSHPHQRGTSLLIAQRGQASMEKHALFQDIFIRSIESQLEARSFQPSALRLCFALPSRLGRLIVTAAASFS